MVKPYVRGTGIHSAGTLSMVNKTGTWRSYDPIVDHDNCISCKICKQFCPDECITRLDVDKSAPKGTPRIEIDMEYCKGCGICAHECPKGAIQMVACEV